jgi:hypothetical protein
VHELHFASLEVVDPDRDHDKHEGNARQDQGSAIWESALHVRVSVHRRS